MNLPLGLDLKSMIAGALFVMFVWPWVMNFVRQFRNS